MFYDIYLELCARNNESPSGVAKKIGLSNAAANGWKKGKMPSELTLVKLARHFGVTTDYLLGNAENPIVQCPDCGCSYDVRDPEEVARHEDRHKKWKAAADKFGFCWAATYREEVKAYARGQIENILSDDEYVDAQLDVFRALFSRSLEASDYSLQHVTFEDYVAMLLNQSQWKEKIPQHIYSVLASDYGVKPGIVQGSYYKIPSQTSSREITFDDFTYAMHGESKKLTDKDKEILLSMARQLAAAHEKKVKNGEAD